jgi:hypothetical protein
MRRRGRFEVHCFARTQGHHLSIRAWVEVSPWLNKPRTAEIDFGELARVSITAWGPGGWTNAPDDENGVMTNHLAGWSVLIETMHEPVKEHAERRYG